MFAYICLDAVLGGGGGGGRNLPREKDKGKGGCKGNNSGDISLHLNNI